eukprot:1580610-Prymnesium_polylepis.3
MEYDNAARSCAVPRGSDGRFVSDEELIERVGRSAGLSPAELQRRHLASWAVGAAAWEAGIGVDISEDGKMASSGKDTRRGWHPPGVCGEEADADGMSCPACITLAYTCPTLAYTFLKHVLPATE